MDSGKKHRINALAKSLGVSAQTVKNYENQGILPRARRDARGWRYYTDEDILKIRALYVSEIRKEEA